MAAGTGALLPELLLTMAVLPVNEGGKLSDSWSGNDLIERKEKERNWCSHNSGQGIIKEKDLGEENESEKMTRPLWGEPTWTLAGGVLRLGEGALEAEHSERKEHARTNVGWSVGLNVCACHDLLFIHC